MYFFCVFFICSLLASLTLFKRDGNFKLIISGIICFILVIFAGTRTVIVGRDYEEYKRLFSLFPSFESIENGAFLVYEPATIFLPIVIKSIFGSQYYLNLTFLLFAFLGVGTKLFAIRKSDFFFLSAMIYCSYLFFGQEMITIRAGIASGLFLLSINDIEKKNDIKFFIKIGLAYLFHYSSFTFVFLWLFKKFNIKYQFLYLCIVLAILIAILKINILTLLRLDLVFPKVKEYLTLLETDDAVPVNVLGFRVLFSLMFLFLFALKIDKVKSNETFMLLFKGHILSLILFFILSPTAIVFSLRIFDLLSVVQILLYPFVILIFKEKIIGYLIIFVFCAIHFCYLFIASGWFINGYETWLF